MDFQLDQIPFPWQQEQWQRLMHQLHQDNLPHALMLVGQEGLGLDLFAQRLALRALCQDENAGEQPCGKCPGCLQFKAGVHPDYKTVRLLEDKKKILVDQIRDLTGFMALTGGQGGGFKVIVIDPADRMNVNAANSLLKTLEEPPGKSLILLVASELHRLPATIKSRCQMIKFTRPELPESLAWLQAQQIADPELLLQMAQGAPIAAAQMDDAVLLKQYASVMEGAIQMLTGRSTIFQLRSQWSGCSAPHLLEWLMAILRDCIRVASYLPDGYFENPSYVSQLRRLNSVLNLQSLFRSYDQLGRLHRLKEHPLSPDLFLDDILLTWQRLQQSG